MWEIQDANGTIFAEGEEEIKYRWNLITNDLLVLYNLYPDNLRADLQQDKAANYIEYSGDLKLVEVKAKYK